MGPSVRGHNARFPGEMRGLLLGRCAHCMEQCPPKTKLYVYSYIYIIMHKHNNHCKAGWDEMTTKPLV